MQEEHLQLSRVQCTSKGKAELLSMMGEGQEQRKGRGWREGEGAFCSERASEYLCECELHRSSIVSSYVFLSIQCTNDTSLVLGGWQLGTPFLLNHKWRQSFGTALLMTPQVGAGWRGGRAHWLG